MNLGSEVFKDQFCLIWAWVQPVSGQTGSKFGIFGGFGWVHSSVLVDEPGFGGVQRSVLPDLGLGTAWFWLNRFEYRAFWRGSNVFQVQF